MATRTLLTSLSPHPTFTLGNALAVSEQHADHAATLLCPPRVELVRLRDETWMQPSPPAAHEIDAALAAVPSSNASSRWYALYSASDTLSFREMDAAREGYDTNCVYSTAFNVQPTCCAIRAVAAAAAESSEARIAAASSDASSTATSAVDESTASAESLLCVSGFSNGALMVLNPFLEKLRVAAGLNQQVADADSAAGGPDLEAQAASAAVAAAAGFSEAAVAAIAALRDRTFNTAPTVLPMRVNCVCWIPPLSNASAASSSAPSPSQQFIAGLADGRLLVFDLRVEEERRLDHPPFAVAILEPEAAAAANAVSLMSASSKHKKESSKVAPASTAAAAASAAPPRVPARQMFHVLQSPLLPAVGSAPALHASNPVMSWQIFTPPNPPPSAAAATAVTAAAAASSSSSSSAAAGASSLLSALSSSINVDPSSVSVLVLEFSVSGAFLALSLSSGHVVVLDWAAHRLVVCFKTLYAPALSLAWTADERYLLSGGEEDLMCVWDPFVSRQLVLVGEGHANFITGIRCRPMLFTQSASDAADGTAGNWDATYRVVSVGQDKLLLFWEFQLPAAAAATTDEQESTQAEQQHPASSRGTPAVTARRTSWRGGVAVAGEEHSDRPNTASPSSASAASAAASPFPAGTYSDLSAQLIPAPRRSSVRTIYPMAKNLAADRAVAWIAVGPDSTASRIREQRRIWASRAPPAVVARALGFGSAAAASAECAAAVSSSSAALPACFVSPDADVLATICHGLRLRFWLRAEPESAADLDAAADGEEFDPQSPASRSSLNNRFTRLHTPVVGRADAHEAVEASPTAAAAARRVSRGPQAPVVRK